MANPPQAISPVSTLPIAAPSTPLLGDTSLTPLAPLMAPRFAASQFYDSVGLYSLHPILSYTSNQYFCTALAGDGNIDFTSHALFVYTFGDCNAVGPAWTTYLVTREQLTDELRAPALAANLPLPLIYIAGGGRNSVLVSPNKDLKSEEEVNALFSIDNKAFGYCEHIHNTPPELHDTFHQCTLDRWLETHDGNPSQRGPSKHNVSRAVLAPPSPSYKPVTSAPRDRGNISHDPTHDSSRDPSATCISRDLSARDPGNLRPRDPGKITQDLSRKWSSTKSLDQTRFGHTSNPLINMWQIVGMINKTCPLNNQRTRDAT